MSSLVHLVRRSSDYLVSSVVGFVSFCLLVGPTALNPGSTKWLRWGDSAQHYYGWEFFRDSDLLQFPLGSSPRFGLGYSSSVVYTDSIPLLAIPVKYLTFWMNSDFQYFGFWLLACFVGQYFFGHQILRRMGVRLEHARIGALFFIIAPVFLHRQTILGYGHMALAGHFLLLAGILLSLENSDSQRRWTVVLAASLLVQFYLFVMILVLWLSSVTAQVVTTKALPQKLVFRAVKTVVLLVGVGWVAGYFSAGSSTEEGFGIFRADLATFVDPQTISATSWSRVLPDQPVTPRNVNGSFEGFAFLGIGVLSALLVGVISQIVRRGSSTSDSNRFRNSLKLVLPPAIVCFVFALSNRVTFRIERIVLPLPEPLELLGNTLRASGRFVWPLTYVAVASAVAMVSRVASKSRVGTALLLMLLAVQIADSREALFEHRERFTQLAYPNSVFQSPSWVDLVRERDYLITDPPQYKGEVWQDFAEFALTHGLATNSGYLSRVNYEKLYQSEVTVRNSLLSKRLQPNTLYVVTRASGAYATLRYQLEGGDGELAPGVRGSFIDGMIAVTSGAP